MIRRTLSLILFVFGGWLLASGIVVAGMSVMHEDSLARLYVVGLMAIASAPFLLLGMWVSPGSRTEELGGALITVAALGAAILVIMAVVTHDPGFKQILPPDKPMPDLRLDPIWSIASIVGLGGGGYLLRRWAKTRAGDQNPDLERIFGDE